MLQQPPQQSATPFYSGLSGGDQLIPPPRNPARMPQGLESAAYDMAVQPAVDMAQGVGALASGAGLGEPIVGAGLMAGLGMLTPGARLAKPVESAVEKGIRAYHGSPHDFERFDISKIGSGEGAQSYGHGLYFAENPETALSYRKNLSDMKDRTIEGTNLTVPSWVANKLESRNPTAINDVRTDFTNRLAEMRKRLTDPTELQPWNIQSNIPGIENILRAVDHFEKGAPIKPAGRMYEVNINAKPDQLIQYEKPLGEQSQHVQDAIRAMPNYESHAKYLEPGGQLGEALKRGLVPGSFRPEGGSAALRDAGIPGIKYLDQGSRAAGVGTNNYVMFDDKLIQILRKYGLAGAAPVGGAAAISQSGDQQ